MTAARLEQEWRLAAHCRNTDTKLFFGEIGGRAAEAAAKAICQKCSVREPCLEFGMRFDGDVGYGIFGGLTGTERRELRELRKERGTA